MILGYTQRKEVEYLIVHVADGEDLKFDMVKEFTDLIARIKEN